MKSPLTGSPNVIPERKVPVRRIISEYAKFGIDVAPYFGKLNAVGVYRCKESGYRFYYPLILGGDSRFYEHFQKFDWYYMPWKWEHDITLPYVHDGDQILEVGCGQGAFLEKLSATRRVSCTGLELNKTAIRENSALTILNETVETHSQANQERYDLVCSYQVLEHIANVRSFIEAQITCLKKGGLLVASVPNNDSFLGRDPFTPLNLPPHHMGLWNTDSLMAIGKEFGLTPIAVEHEPLQEYHFDTYILSKLLRSGRLTARILYRILRIPLLRKPIYRNLMKKRHFIRGHSVLIVLRKPQQ
jgi:SAM-dependent methyltransferase